ncbi:MAG: hypothetical protein Q8O42_06885 [Acidobacteriota bacterium]|nr:hypothetical protein [Acidobacteriota bacterium]
MTSSTKLLTILQINDTHGYLEPHPELFWQGDQAEYRSAGGYARLLMVLKQVRLQRHGAVIALDNGDTFHGTFHAVHSEGQALIEPLNLLGLDAWTAHWDIRTLREQERVDLEHTLAADPYQQMGGYVKRCFGVNIYIKVENPFGSRIQQFFVNGDAVDADRSYTAAFITSQGVPKKYGSDRRDLPITAIDALRRYFGHHPTVNADLRGAVVVV